MAFENEFETLVPAFAYPHNAAPVQVTSDLVFVEKIASMHAGNAVFHYDPKRGRGGGCSSTPSAKGGKSAAGAAAGTGTEMQFGIRHYAGQVM